MKRLIPPLVYCMTYRARKGNESASFMSGYIIEVVLAVTFNAVDDSGQIVKSEFLWLNRVDVLPDEVFQRGVY
jgi:hypothetical protein